ncbi:MAG: Bug family tripartite tricarboxylate transporter substrate binding protein [Burkholderiales bacterium]
MQILFLAAALVAASINVQAQAWPAKPIRIIVPAVGGSAVDVGMRRVAPKLAEALGQPVIVENRPGANSMIGAREVARMPADGYTLLHANINNALNDLLAPDPCCRLNQELVPISRMFASPMVMVVNPSVPATTLREYIALAKAKGQSITFASGGTGSLTQLVGETLKVASGINIAEVPYKSIGAEVPDLLAGHVMTGFLAPSAVAQHVKAGKLRALALADPSRIGILPDVPTTTEAGLPALQATGWNGLYAPAGTPEPVIRRLHAELAKALAAPDIREDAKTNGWVLGGDQPEEFAAYVRAEMTKWGRIIREANIKVQ